MHIVNQLEHLNQLMSESPALQSKKPSPPTFFFLGVGRVSKKYEKIEIPI